MSLTCNTIDNRISVDGQFKTVDGEFKAVRRDIAGMGERLARVEGHLMAPGGFTLPTPQPSVVVDPPPGDPSAGW